jgi:hypothetical protein
MHDELRTPPRRDGRRILVRVAIGAVALVAALWVVVTGVEAEKEVRVLCSMAPVGTPEAEVDRLFSTGNLIRVRPAAEGDATILRVSSTANLGLTGCTVRLAGGTVIDVGYHERVRLARVAGVTALVGLGWLVALHALLAGGAPLGHLGWGGAHRRLPVRLRVASGAVGLVLAVGAVCFSDHSGLTSVIGLPGAAETGTGVLTVVFLLSIAANLASASAWERRTGTPVAFLLTCCGVVLVLAG